MIYRVMMLIILCGSLAGCKSVQQASVSTSFRVGKNGVDWIVENNSGRSLAVEGLTGGIDYRKTTTYDGEELGVKGPVIAESVAPVRFIVAEKVIIPPGARHSFAVEQLRHLEENETADIHMRLTPGSLNISGRFELIDY